MFIDISTICPVFYKPTYADRSGVRDLFIMGEYGVKHPSSK